MMYSPEELLSRAQAYCKKHSLELGKKLGHGMQGIVYSASRTKVVHESAIKIHSKKIAYQRERDVYQRLLDRDVTRIKDFAIPKLLNSDENLLVVEMALVHPPFIVDFGGAYLDQLPDHAQNPTVAQNWINENIEQFGENWNAVKEALIYLEQVYKVYIVDVNPGNIQFKQAHSRRV